MKTLLTIVTIAAVSFIGWSSVRIVKSINFNQQCSGYLKRAANANTVDLAKRELDRAIGYLNKNDIKSGYTSILWRTPNEDIGYWYDNLSASMTELNSIDVNASQLEKSNILMKLRETLIDNGAEGDTLTMPDGISVYPNNTLFALWGWVSFLVMAVGVTFVGFRNI